MLDKTELLRKITIIQETLNLPEERLQKLASAMSASHETSEQIFQLFQNADGSRYLGGEDRFLTFLTNLTARD